MSSADDRKPSLAEVLSRLAPLEEDFPKDRGSSGRAGGDPLTRRIVPLGKLTRVTMSASQEAETSPARGHSPRFRWFLLWCVVLYYTLYGVGTFLIPSERSSLEQTALVLGFALITLAFGSVGVAAWGFPGSGSGHPGTVLDRLDRVPDWLAYSVMFLGGALAMVGFVFVIPRMGMGEFRGPAFVTGLCLFWLGYVCEPRPLVRPR